LNDSHQWRLSNIPENVKLWESPRQSRGFTHGNLKKQGAGFDQNQIPSPALVCTLI